MPATKLTPNIQYIICPYDGVAIADIISDLVLQPGEKEKIITIPHILPDDMPSKVRWYGAE